MTKKNFVLLIMMFFVFVGASSVFAGGILNKQNFSVEYLRTFSRNAATDSADAVGYNPAGVMNLETGSYVNIGMFHASKDYVNIFNDNEKSISKEPSVVPGLFCVHKEDRWSVFGAFTVPGGGGKVDFPHGVATSYRIASEVMTAANAQLVPGISAALQGPPFGLPAAAANAMAQGVAYDNFAHSVELEGYHLGFTFGGAYKINDMISVAVGIRCIDAIKDAEGHARISASVPSSSIFPGFGSPFAGFNDDIIATIKYEETADDVGGFFGVNITPNDKLNIGFRFETKTELKYKMKVKEDTLDILEERRNMKTQEDLPGLIGLGVGYKITPKLKTDVSYTYYLEKNASWSDTQNSLIRSLRNAGDSYDLAVAFEYTFNDMFRGSAGYMMTNTNIASDDMYPFAPELDAYTYCMGFAWNATSDLTFNLALMRTSYENAGTTGENGTTPEGIVYDKDIHGFGLGVEYRFN